MNGLPPSVPSKMKQLTPLRRELMLRVMDGDNTLGPAMFAWNHRPRCEEVLRWLIQHGYTGKNLSHMMYTVWGARLHGFFQWVLQQIDRLEKPPAIIIGKDWKV